MIRNHPYEYVFFAAPFRKAANENFDFDYWVVSFADQLKYLYRVAPSGIVKVWSNHPDLANNALLMFDDIEKQRVEIRENADYYLLSSLYRKDPRETLPFFHLIHSIDADGMALASLSSFVIRAAIRPSFLMNTGTIAVSLKCMMMMPACAKLIYMICITPSR